MSCLVKRDCKRTWSVMRDWLKCPLQIPHLRGWCYVIKYCTFDMGVPSSEWFSEHEFGSNSFLEQRGFWEGVWVTGIWMTWFKNKLDGIFRTEPQHLSIGLINTPLVTCMCTSNLVPHSHVHHVLFVHLHLADLPHHVHVNCNHQSHEHELNIYIIYIQYIYTSHHKHANV